MLNQIKKRLTESSGVIEGMNFKIPVLCYHSLVTNGTSYSENDHVALENDLAALANRGYKVLPIGNLINILQGSLPSSAIRSVLNEKLVCLTFDDGHDFDFVDSFKDEIGSIKSFHTILRESQSYLAQFSAGYRAVSFVIASPEARKGLDITCAEGKGEWQDSWWRECADKGILGIANHSWDHVHDTLSSVRQSDNKKGSFYEIKTFSDAEAQISDAQEYINSIVDNKTVAVFAYPYGHVSAYLRDHYLPEQGRRIGLKAAFSTVGGPVTAKAKLWSIPRYVCGEHWKSPEEFAYLLDSIDSHEEYNEAYVE